MNIQQLKQLSHQVDCQIAYSKCIVHLHLCLNFLTCNFIWNGICSRWLRLSRHIGFSTSSTKPEQSSDNIQLSTVVWLQLLKMMLLSSVTSVVIIIGCYYHLLLLLSVVNFSPNLVQVSKDPGCGPEDGNARPGIHCEDGDQLDAIHQYSMHGKCDHIPAYAILQHEGAWVHDKSNRSGAHLHLVHSHLLLLVHSHLAQPPRRQHQQAQPKLNPQDCSLTKHMNHMTLNLTTSDNKQ